MKNCIELSQGDSIYLYQDEVPLIENMLISQGISLDCLDKNQSILNLNQRYSGYIETQSRTIFIKPKNPKISFSHIVRMYYYVFFNKYNKDGHVLDLTFSDNYVSIIDLFLNELSILSKKGLPKDYIELYHNSQFKHGSLRLKDTYKNILLNKQEPFCVDFEEMVYNTPINRYIYLALLKVSRLTEYKSKTYKFKKMFDGVDELVGSFDVKNIVFNKNNEYCKNAVFFANLIIENQYYDALGNSSGDVFLIDCDYLFESFIRKILIESKEGSLVSSWSKPKPFGSYDEKIKTYNPDLLYGYISNTNEALGIIDAKNKYTSSFNNSDVYQMVFYSLMLNSKSLILCYPSSCYCKPKVLNISSKSSCQLYINAVYIDIAGSTKQAFKDSISKFKSEVFSLLRNSSG